MSVLQPWSPTYNRDGVADLGCFLKHVTVIASTEPGAVYFPFEYCKTCVSDLEEALQRFGMSSPLFNNSGLRLALISYKRICWQFRSQF